MVFHSAHCDWFGELAANSIVTYHINSYHIILISYHIISIQFNSHHIISYHIITANYIYYIVIYISLSLSLSLIPGWGCYSLNVTQTESVFGCCTCVFCADISCSNTTREGPIDTDHLVYAFASMRPAASWNVSRFCHWSGLIHLSQPIPTCRPFTHLPPGHSHPLELLYSRWLKACLLH